MFLDKVIMIRVCKNIPFEIVSCKKLNRQQTKEALLKKWKTVER